MHDGAAFDFYVQLDRLTFVDQRDRQGFAQPRRIWAELNCPTGLGNLKLMLQGGNRHHAPVGVQQMLPSSSGAMCGTS